MIGLVSELLEKGHAYVAKDGSGDVYFDVSSWPHYGELTNQSVEDLQQGEAHSTGKRNAEDFALWKGKKSEEPATASWPSPWGAGRPGWHLECSAMSMRYLGSHYDIHGGGVDLRFPHHENERAQAMAAGYSYANYWLHNALVVVNGQKMSKSLGNSVFATDLLAQAKPVVVRYALASAHYRSELDIHDGFVSEAVAAFARIEGFLARAEALGSVSPGEIPRAFADAMDDDLSIPSALAVVHESVRSGNHALDSGDSEAALRVASEVRAMVSVLGIDPLAPEWKESGVDNEVLGAVVDSMIALRWQAKAEKNFALSDSLRDALDNAGIDVHDGPSGSTWSLRG